MMAYRPVSGNVENGTQLVGSFGPFRRGDSVAAVELVAGADTAVQLVFRAAWAEEPAAIEEDVDEAEVAYPVLSMSVHAPADSFSSARVPVNERAKGRWLVFVVHHSTSGPIAQVTVGVDPILERDG